MRKKLSCAIMTLLWVAFMPNLLVSPAVQENRYLTVNGLSSQVAVLQINGRYYADLEALARAVNGSLAFNGNQIALTLLRLQPARPRHLHPTLQPPNPDFPRPF